MKPDLRYPPRKSVYSIDFLTDDKFVRFNLQELLNLAANGGDEDKEWLKQLLTKLEESPDKRKLLEALK
jgi:hypothetical protein